MGTKLLLTLSAAFLISTFSSFGQENKLVTENKSAKKSNPYPVDVVSLGFGLGLDYGGFGMNLTVYPQKNIGIFGGIGYALAGLGYNGGIKTRITFNKNKPNPSLFAVGMYGYNTAFKVKNASQYNKIFYGPSVGLGLETSVKPNKALFFSFAIHVPIRSQEALNYQDRLKSNPYISMENDLLPVAISLGLKLRME